ncbi:MAG: phosphohydrolase [Paenibacillaceae bacterium]|nr:MAG: phosphohydrolase [Paenibacillaceae bacterium]
MRTKLWSWLAPGLLIGISLGAFFAIDKLSHPHAKLEHPVGHFYIVAIVSLLAMLVSIAVGVAGIKLRNVNITFLSIGFISLAGLFMLHGLSTPGFVVSEGRALPALAGSLSVVIASAWVFLSALPTDLAVVRWLSRLQRALLPAWSAVLALGILLAVANAGRMERLLSHPAAPHWVSCALTAAFCLFAMYRYRKLYVMTRFPIHLGIVCSSGLLIVSIMIMVYGTVWEASWWLYHFTLFGSVLIMVGGVVVQYIGQPSVAGLFKTLFRPDPRGLIESSISPSVRSLIAQTENKDAYTAGHNYRVAMYALRLAEHMGVQPRMLRALAQGGIVHDVGKLFIPDEVLNKPGKLTPEERAVIELHPVYGYSLCKQLGFMSEELEIIRSHHERWDGTGYPDRLKGEAIPMLARIAAVADVYDALTSSRAYRAAMSHEDAMRIIVKESGRQFDPRCVDAWVALAEDDPEFFRAMRGKAAAVKAAAVPAAGAT